MLIDVPLDWYHFSTQSDSLVSWDFLQTQFLWFQLKCYLVRSVSKCVCIRFGSHRSRMSYSPKNYFRGRQAVWSSSWFYVVQTNFEYSISNISELRYKLRTKRGRLYFILEIQYLYIFYITIFIKSFISFFFNLQNYVV